MLKADEVAEILGIKSRTVYQLFNAGKLPGYKYGRAVRFEPSEIRALAGTAGGLRGVRELREYERLRQRAEAVGATDLPTLSPQQRELIQPRERRMRMAPWADSAAIRAVYEEARRLSKETGVPHHVDHIVPLLGEFVSGLHVETNLQILAAADNQRKLNRFEVA